jgi:hypothetical protein
MASCPELCSSAASHGGCVAPAEPPALMAEEVTMACRARGGRPLLEVAEGRPICPTVGFTSCDPMPSPVCLGSGRGWQIGALRSEGLTGEADLSCVL